MSWQFKREEQQFDIIPEGRHRIRIKSADTAMSKNGNDMIVFQFEVSGYRGIIYHYITFMNDKPEITNRLLTQFFDSFKDIPEGDFDMANWVGKAGACTIKHEEYNGDERAKIGYFIPADKAKNLPPWKNPDGSTPPKVDADGFLEVSDVEEDFFA